MKTVIVIGGGLSGLISAIQLAKAGIHVLLFERKNYPFHRVCGEFVSNETIPFLKANGIFPEEFNPPHIHRLQLTSVNGKWAELPLKQGGWGISRYTFDHFLYIRAREAGVVFHLNTEVLDVSFAGNQFTVHTSSQSFTAEVVIGTFGKRSKLDMQMKRAFIQKRSPYVGVKYHIRYDHPEDCIALHNFQDGYCGISNIENGKTNLCYLTHRDHLRRFGSIRLMEERVLFENPFLKKIFQHAEFLFDKPEVINEISFEKKSPVEDHILMAGDSAGMITPLCGNGMAMAIHSAKLLSDHIISFCKDELTRDLLEKNYAQKWNATFAQRLWAGKKIQHLFGSEWTSDLAVNIARHAKPIAQFLINQTHGKPF